MRDPRQIARHAGRADRAVGVQSFAAMRTPCAIRMLVIPRHVLRQVAPQRSPAAWRTEALATAAEEHERTVVGVRHLGARAVELHKEAHLAAAACGAVQRVSGQPLGEQPHGLSAHLARKVPRLRRRFRIWRDESELDDGLSIHNGCSWRFGWRWRCWERWLGLWLGLLAEGAHVNLREQPLEIRFRRAVSRVDEADPSPVVGRSAPTRLHV